VIVRLVVSHPLIEPWTFSFELVKTTRQETVVDVLTLTLVFEVLLVAGEAAPVSVIVSVNSAVPVQSPLENSVNTNVPSRAEPPADATVAVSFGSQSWAVAIDVTSLTKKHSASPSPLKVNAPG
jgi:hypothetical protein